MDELQTICQEAARFRQRRAALAAELKHVETRYQQRLREAEQAYAERVRSIQAEEQRARAACDAGAQKQISGYLTQREQEGSFWCRSTHYHRPLSFYFNLAAACGFSLVRMTEPPAYNPAENSSGLPLFLCAEFEKPKSGTAEGEDAE